MTTDNKRGEGVAVKRNGGLAGGGKHRLREKKPSLMMKMGSIKGTAATSGPTD